LIVEAAQHLPCSLLSLKTDISAFCHVSDTLNTASKRQGFAGFSGQTDAESYLLSRRRMLSFLFFQNNTCK
jgi:hypothetical protein